MCKIIIPLLLSLCVFTGNNALAHTPQARETHGVVQNIDFEKKILTLAYDQGRGPQKLLWKTDTQFLRDQKRVPATELKEGTQVTAFYHSPFFGKPFATKIILNSKS